MRFIMNTGWRDIFFLWPSPFFVLLEEKWFRRVLDGRLRKLCAKKTLRCRTWFSRPSFPCMSRSKMCFQIFRELGARWRSRLPLLLSRSFLFQCSSSFCRLLASGESPRLLRMATESAHSLHRERKGGRAQQCGCSGCACTCLRFPVHCPPQLPRPQVGSWLREGRSSWWAVARDDDQPSCSHKPTGMSEGKDFWTGMPEAKARTGMSEGKYFLKACLTCQERKCRKMKIMSISVPLSDHQRLHKPMRSL